MTTNFLTSCLLKHQPCYLSSLWPRKVSKSQHRTLCWNVHLYEEERDWINNIHSVHYHYSSPAFFLLENVQVHVHINSTFVSSPAAILTSCILISTLINSTFVSSPAAILTSCILISTLINSTYMLLLYCMPWRRLCESKRWYYCGFSLTDTSLTLGSASPSFCSKPNPNPNPNRWPAIPRLTPQWQTALHPPPDPSEMSY